MSTKRILLLLISILLFGCNPSRGIVIQPTVTPSIAPAVVHTQLAMPIATPIFDSIVRVSNDFLPPPTPLPSATPTNVFFPVVNKEGYSDLVITLQRQMCLGPCPVYSILIYGNGTGVYEGKMNVNLIGIQEFTLSEEQLEELVEAFDSIHYFSLDEFYSVNVFDVSITATSITFQGHSKAVGHSGGCVDHAVPTFTTDVPEYFRYYPAPQVVCDLEQTIEEIVNVEQWTGK
jgi:hypothetical protein